MVQSQEHQLLNYKFWIAGKLLKTKNNDDEEINSFKN